MLSSGPDTSHDTTTPKAKVLLEHCDSITLDTLRQDITQIELGAVQQRSKRKFNFGTLTNSRGLVDRLTVGHHEPSVTRSSSIVTVTVSPAT